MERRPETVPRSFACGHTSDGSRRRFDMDSCWISGLKISGAGTVYNFDTVNVDGEPEA